MRLFAAAGGDHLRPARDPGEHDAEHVMAPGRAQLVQVVEHQHERRGSRAECRREQRSRATQRRHAVAAHILGEVAHARRDAGVCRRQQREHRSGVVVEAIERRPCDGPALEMRPLGQQRRLAVPGGGGDADHPQSAASCRLDEPGATHRFSGRTVGDGELRVEQKPIKLDPCRRRSRGFLEHARILRVARRHAQ